MKLYLSSYHFGARVDQFAAMFTTKKRIAVIANALDFSTDLEKLRNSKLRDLQELQSIGLNPEHLDLREYFDKPEALREKIREYGGVWVRGGNTFILRKALAASGLDTVLQQYWQDDRPFVYGGFSAGACVVTPTLHGIDLADEPELTPQGYDSEIIWDGLGFVPYSIAPHFRSDHPEASLIEKSVEYFQKNNIPFVGLRDGEDIVVNSRAEAANNPQVSME